jgi:hypothetical protein
MPAAYVRHLWVYPGVGQTVTDVNGAASELFAIAASFAVRFIRRFPNDFTTLLFNFGRALARIPWG